MKVKLIDVRLSFPDLFEAVEYQKGDGKPRYNATFLVEPGSENHKRIEAAIKAAADERWQKKADATVASMRTNSNKFCYLDGNSKDYDGYEGMMYLSSHRKVSDGRPYVVDRNKAPLSAADGKPYAGCYVNASVEIYAQGGENPGVRCGLLGVQFSRDGDSFSGAGRASDEDFDDLGVPEEADDLAA